MIPNIPNSISVHASFDLEAAPDCTLIKLHFVGEGMTLEDAVTSVQQKVSETIEALKSKYSAIESTHVFDVYFGQKEDRIRSEAQSFPRPLVVQAVLIRLPPADTAIHYKIVDDGIKRGALLENPRRPSYFSDTLDSAILYGLADSQQHQTLALEGCLREAAKLANRLALASGKRLGELISISNSVIEPSMGDPLRKDYSYICRTLPTKFLSPTPQKVILSAKLLATYCLSE